MPSKTDNSQSQVIGARFSYTQIDAIKRHIGDETPTDYVRRLITEDLHANGIELPEHEFIPNEERAEKGLPWISNKRAKTDR